MPLYMRKDTHGYRFLRPVPKDLIDHIGKANFVKRLGRSYKEARLLCAELTVQTDRELALARANRNDASSVDSFLRLSPDTRLKKLSVSPELAGQVASHWLHSSLEADAQARKDGLDDEEFDALDEAIKEVLPLVNRALATGQVGKFHEFVNQLLTWRGYLLEATDSEWQTLTYEVLRQVQAGYRILAARQHGDIQEPPVASAVSTPLPAAWESQKPPASKRVGRLSDITPLYQEHLQTSSSKTQTTSLSVWQRFVDYTQDKPRRSATSGDIFDFLKSRLHDTDKPWSYSYASGHVVKVLRNAFDLAKTRNLVDKNPVDELCVLPQISKKEEESRRKPRFPYKAQHLNTLFKSEWYNPESCELRGKIKEDLGARYWIPMLCMWHGLRVTEATQLQTHDVDLAQCCILIQVVDDADEVGPDRSLKNSATTRAVPIHPALLELGFLDFVRTVTLNYAKGPLFPSALPKQGGKSPEWGRSYKQAFLRFVRDKLEFGHGYGSHSFRHALEDRIRSANAEQRWPDGMTRAYTGRANPRLQDRAVIREEGSEKRYGKGYAPNEILRYIRTIRYSDVQLPLPFKSWLGDREVVSVRLLTLVRQWKS